MRSKFPFAVGPFLGAAILVTALWVLHAELTMVRYDAVVRGLRQIPAWHLLAALLVTGLNYLVLTGYDRLAFRYIQHPLQYSRIALASFIGYAFSNSIGLSMLTGSSVRYRLYSSWGLSAQEIAKVVAFTTLTLWLGLFTVAGGTFLLKPVNPATWTHLHLAASRPLGCLLLLPVCLYVVSGIIWKKPFQVLSWEVPLPPLELSLQQIAVSGLDWILAGGVLYILMGSFGALSFPSFLSIYLLGQFSGLVSQVPGGLGVFESVVTVGLSPSLPAGTVLASLIAYRVVYYLLPLLTAITLLGLHELFEKGALFRRGMHVLGRWMPHLAPHIFSLMVFIAGVILLISGATPSVGRRMTFPAGLLPASVAATFHFLGSLIGMVLLLVARGLQLKLDGAYFVTVALLGAGVAASLLKGVDYEEAAVLAVILTTLIPCRKYFNRKATLLAQPFTPGWVASVGLVLLTSLWISIFSHRHAQDPIDMWWAFTSFEHAPRSFHATFAAVIACLLVAVNRLLRPAPPRMPPVVTDEDREVVHRTVRLSPNSAANLALLDDKYFHFSQTRRSFIMYRVEGRSWVAMGDPVGERGEWEEIVWEYRETCDRYGGWTVFYEVGREGLPIYLDLGLTLFKIGEEATVPLKGFSLEGKSRKGFRKTCNRMEREGYSFQVIEAPDVPALLPRLKEISDAWLREKHTREKRFSLGRFDPRYLSHFPVAVIRREDEIPAFCNLWTGADKEELSMDLMRHLPGSPPETMEYLVVRLMEWGKEQGYRRFNLGMAPLSGLNGRSLAPAWNRVGALIYRHGEHFYNFKGLRLFKQKFDPEWGPKYIACPGRLVLPRVLASIAALTSGGMKGVITK